MICVLHDFLVEVDLWNGLDHFVKLQPSLTGSQMLGDWLAATFLCGIYPRTSRCLGRRPLVCFACRWLCSSLACCWLCSCFACCWLCSSAWCCLLFCLLLALLFSVLFIIAPDLRVLLAVLVPALLYFVLLLFSPLARWLWFFFRVNLW